MARAESSVFPWVVAAGVLGFLMYQGRRRPTREGSPPPPDFDLDLNPLHRSGLRRVVTRGVGAFPLSNEELQAKRNALGRTIMAKATKVLGPISMAQLLLHEGDLRLLNKQRNTLVFNLGWYSSGGAPQDDTQVLAIDASIRALATEIIGAAKVSTLEVALASEKAARDEILLEQGRRARSERTARSTGMGDERWHRDRAAERAWREKYPDAEWTNPRKAIRAQEAWTAEWDPPPPPPLRDVHLSAKQTARVLEEQRQQQAGQRLVDKYWAELKAERNSQ